MAIRISKKDRRKLRVIYGNSNKARKKYNRLRRKGVDESQLPIVPTSADKLTAYAKGTNMSRQDFNKMLDELVNFSTPYNPEYIFDVNNNGVAISKTKYNKAVKATKEAQKAKEEHYSDIMETTVNTPTENSIVTPEVLTEFGADLPLKPIKDFDPDSITSAYGLESYIENVGKQDLDYFTKRDQLYFDNFRSAMFTIFNSSADDIVNLLDEMGMETFMKAYVRDFLDMNLDYIYDEAEVQNKKEEVYTKVSSAFSEITGKEVPQNFPKLDTTTINSETGEIIE